MQGGCGERANWSLSPDGTVLTISGRGPMTDYRGPGEVPWRPFAGTVARVAVEEGVSTLGNYAFQDCGAGEVRLPRSLRRVGACAFAGCAALTELRVPEGTEIIAAKAFSGAGSLKTVHLPASLRAVDMKAFHYDGALRDVYYAGTAEQWEQIRVSPSARGNADLLGAAFHFAGPGGAAPIRERGPGADRRGELLAAVRETLQKGGDGRLYVLAPDLSEPKKTAKTGDCTFFVFPNGETMLLDSGVANSEGNVLGLLRELGLARLDWFVLSHPHADHAGNALAAAEYLCGAGGGVGAYRYTGCPDPEGKDTEAAVAAFFAARGADVDRAVRAGCRWTIGGVAVDVLGPTEEELRGGGTADKFVNNASLLLKMTFGASAYLTCGDLYAGQERKVVEREGSRLRASVAKANHHGLYTSNSPEWLKAVSPKILIAENDDVGSSVLAEDARERGIAYYSAGVDGDVLAVLDDAGNCRVVTRYDSDLRGDPAPGWRF